jgi:hypothetical protein
MWKCLKTTLLFLFRCLPHRAVMHNLLVTPLNGDHVTAMCLPCCFPQPPTHTALPSDGAWSMVCFLPMFVTSASPRRHNRACICYASAASPASLEVRMKYGNAISWKRESAIHFMYQGVAVPSCKTRASHNRSLRKCQLISADDFLLSPALWLHRL